MKTKLCWIPFIPVVCLMIFIKYMETAIPADGTFLGLNQFGLRYAAILLIPILLISCIAISLFDKKMSPYYLISKNFGAALFSFITAVAVMFQSVMSIVNTFSTGNINALNFVVSLIGIIAGVAMLFIASAHLSGKNIRQSLSIFMLLPAIWAGFKLIETFLSYTTVSVRSQDMLDLLCYALVALFFFADAMALCNMEGKNPVKRCFVFGFPLIAALLAYSVKEGVCIIKNYAAYEILDILDVAIMLSIALYALFFLIELSINAIRKEQVCIVNDDEQSNEINEPTKREEVNFSYEDNGEELNSVDYEDSSVLEIPDEGEEVTVSEETAVSEEDTDVSENDENSSADISDVSSVTDEGIKDTDFVVAPQENEKNDELKTRMDEIDKLILEIQTKSEINDD
ncbi:MAG: hypothetical protein PUD24_02495 [Oscillospiraceae bacterium]|nr:hypothetical protein [Oscillospiraceae bacterium]